MATIFAGPGTNYLFAFVLGVLMFGWAGDPAGAARAPSVIGTVERGSPASVAGLLAEDRIVAVDGKPTQWSDEVRAIVQASGGRPVKFRVQRAEQNLDLVVKPREQGGGYRVGISFNSTPVWKPLPIGQAVVRAAEHPIDISREQIAGLWKLASGKGSTEDVGGPVMIVDQLKGSFDRGPWTALYALIFMNVVIGLLNLLPLPALDGGRLAFLAYNVVTRRRANMRVEMAVHTIGFLLLFGLLIMITVRDVGRLFGG